MTQECAKYRALYEKIVLPPDVGPRVDWARVLEQKQVGAPPVSETPQGARGSHLTQSAIPEPRVPRGLLRAWTWEGAGKGESTGDRAAREGFLQEGACEEVGGFS